jgi:transposase
MFIKREKKKFADGSTKTFISLVEGYRPSKGSTTKLRTIKSYGYEEDQIDKNIFYDNIENDKKQFIKETESEIIIRIQNIDNKNNADFNKRYNYGYLVVEGVFEQLGIKSCFLNENGIDQFNYDIFQFLVYQRVLTPSSKRRAIQGLERFYDKNYKFSLSSVYDSLTLIGKNFQCLQQTMRANVDMIVSSFQEVIYYDCTNYYCEIDTNDPEPYLRAKGVSKEHRVEPIVGLGLFMDKEGLPIQFNLHRGNVSESTTLIPGITEIKNKYNYKRIVVVADKGLNSGNNIIKLIKNGDGYLFSQTIKGKKGKRFQEQVFNDEGWQCEYNSDGNIKYKCKIYTEDIELTEIIEKEDGKREYIKHPHKQKIMIYYDLESDEMSKAKRQEKIDKAIKSLNNNAFTVKHGYEEYLTDKSSLSSTGEVADVKERYLNTDKVENDAKYDGYFAIVTSELDYTIKTIREKYHNLWRIEDNFRISKTDLEFRPIYHFKDENIIGHFLTCYTSLVIVKVIKYILKKSNVVLSIDRIQRVLNAMNLQKMQTGILHLECVEGLLAFKEVHHEKDYTPITSVELTNDDQVRKDFLDICKVFDIHLDYSFVKQEKFRKEMKKINHRITFLKESKNKENSEKQ